ncbi:hypothetical protein TWF718_003445 [Orbilia javanica]|uniref:Uncharacterized protein n=1 Tax=Orbilia javanica TaxID=47235 RepID=A0AAN8MST5_9PEZI
MPFMTYKARSGPQPISSSREAEVPGPNIPSTKIYINQMLTEMPSYATLTFRLVANEIDYMPLQVLADADSAPSPANPFCSADFLPFGNLTMTVRLFARQFVYIDALPHLQHQIILKTVSLLTNTLRVGFPPEFGSWVLAFPAFCRGVGGDVIIFLVNPRFNSNRQFYM